MRSYNTQIDQITFQNKADVLGEHESSFFVGRNGEKYLVKTGLNLITEAKDPEYYYFLEALAARFYEFFSPETYTAETKLVTTSTGEVNIGSLWIDEFIPYDDIILPLIQDDRIVTTINSHIYEVQGYISMLLTARLIGNHDCIGKGINAGVKYNKERDLYENVKIDTGGSFLFITDNPINHIFGIAVQYTNKIEQTYNEYDEGELPDFVTYIPLELIDNEDHTKLNNEFSSINIFIDYFHPNYDVRDLLIDKLPYAEIAKNKELYHQLVFAIHRLVSATNEDLISLIYDEMPESINGEDLNIIKSDIYDKINLRREKMAQIYRVELEYYKLYIEFSDSMDFETMKSLALTSSQNSSKKLESLMDDLQIIIVQKQFTRLIINKIGQYEFITKNSLKEENLLFSRITYLIKAVEIEDFNMVNAILKNRPTLVSHINTVLTIEENHGTTAILRTKKHLDLRIAKLLLDYGANPRKQILYENDEDGSIKKHYFDVVNQLPENLKALILEQEEKMGCSFLEIEDLEIIEQYYYLSDSSSECDTEEKEPDQNIVNFNFISEIIGQNFLDELPNYFSLFTKKSGTMALQYINSLVQNLNLILEHIEDYSLTTAIILNIENIFDSLNRDINSWHIYLGLEEINPDEYHDDGYYSGGGYYQYDDASSNVNNSPFPTILVGKISNSTTLDK